MRRFAASDDAEREEILQAASTQDLVELLNSVNSSAFAAINRYLDDTGNAEEAVPYGDLAQAAMEAQLVLSARS